MTSRAEIERRIDAIETQLATTRSPRAVATWAAAQWNVTPRQARTYIERARERWTREAGIEDRRSRRDAMRASLNALFHAASTRTEIVRDKRGQPVIDPATGVAMTQPAPDLRAALRAADALCRLDGLYADRVEVDVTTRSGEGKKSLADRSKSELFYYGDRGCWPDDPGAPPERSREELEHYIHHGHWPDEWPTPGGCAQAA